MTQVYVFLDAENIDPGLFKDVTIFVLIKFLRSRTNLFASRRLTEKVITWIRKTVSLIDT